MPVKVFSNSSNNSENRIDTLLIVQKPQLRTLNIDFNIEEDIDMKNQNRIKNLPCPQEKPDAVCNSYVDSGWNHPVQ